MSERDGLRESEYECECSSVSDPVSMSVSDRLNVSV